MLVNLKSWIPTEIFTMALLATVVRLVPHSSPQRSSLSDGKSLLNTLDGHGPALDGALGSGNWQFPRYSLVLTALMDLAAGARPTLVTPQDEPSKLVGRSTYFCRMAVSKKVSMVANSGEIRFWEPPKPVSTST